MAQTSKHLFELLKEDQEPFYLKDYIAHRRCQLVLTKTNSSSSSRPNHDHYNCHAKKMIKRSSSTNTITKPKTLPQKLLPKNACFSSTSKSPLFEFPLSPISINKSPCKRAPNSPNPILLHIPAKTAALLLEAAMRIQKQSNSNGQTNMSKPKPQKFGLFGSLLKRLTSHRSNKKKEMPILKSSPQVQPNLIIKARDVNSNFDGSTKFSCSRPSSTSGVWSDQSNEEKSMEFSISTSDTSQWEESVDFVTKLMMMRPHDDDDYHDRDDGDFEFCDQSPFRFVLQRSPSCSPLSFSGRRTPEFSSPVPSPARRRSKQEGKENYVTENSKAFEEELEEEEKEQFSPVSVLDPPFEDDYDRVDDEDHEHEDVASEEDDEFDLESSFAIVQRTKQKLLQKLRRFERLAELDPIELEKRMLEDDQEEEEDADDESMEEKCEEISDLDGFIQEVLSNSTTFCPSHHRGPGHMKRLVLDLIVEEQKLLFSSIIDQDQEIVIKGVVKRFESWKEVQSNTIDMMVEQDFRKELEAWKDNKEQIGETAIEIELAIFGLLVEELALELVC